MENYIDVTVTYRCYNCGYKPWDGPVYSKNTYETWNNVISYEGVDSEGNPIDAASVAKQSLRAAKGRFGCCPLV